MMYDRLRDLLVNEAQFDSRPGGDGSGEKKGNEAERAALINTMSKTAHRLMKNPKREPMPRTATGVRRVLRRGR